MSGASSVPVLVLTGPVGVGKTTVASAASDLLDERGAPHAVIDLDWLRWCHPNPPDDPFHAALGLGNLAAVWRNYRTAGADRLVLVDVVEAREQLEEYRAAIPGAAVTVVRLAAGVPTLHRRLEGRETGASLAWHRARAVELAALMDARRVEDVLLDTEGRTPRDIAAEALRRTGWG